MSSSCAFSKQLLAMNIESMVSGILRPKAHPWRISEKRPAISESSSQLKEIIWLVLVNFMGVF